MKIHFLPAQTNEEDNILLSPRIISTNTTEDISKRNEWQREFIVEKEIEYYDEDLRETVRETIQSKIVEVGSGINYLDGDEWKPSNPHFVQTPNGFELVESCYKVKFGHRLTDVMTYESNGVSIPMRISSIIISDGINQRTLTPNVNVIGTIDQNNASILHFINGFNNIDVTYRADKGGFHQDVKIKNLASLQFDGINERNAKVYVYTKIDDTAFSLNNLTIKKGEEAIDTTSPLFSSTAPSKSEQLIITKTLDTKEIPLFGFDQSAIFDSEGKETTSATRQIIKKPNTSGIYLVESIKTSELQDGSVIDYYGWQGSITNATVWTADATYTVTGDLNLSAELKIEPGTLVKFYGNYSINVNTGGKIIAEGEPWNYIVFTSSYGSTPGSYDEAINISGGSSDSKISYCKINYATEGIQIQNCTLSTPIRDNIITNCTKGIRFLDGAPNNVINNLIYSCTSIGVEILGIEGTYTLYSNTIDNCGTCIYVGGDPEAEDPTVTIRDTIISNWTTNGIKVLYNADMDVDYVTYKPDQSSWKYGIDVDELGNHNVPLTNSPYATNSVMGNYYLNGDYLDYYANDGEATASDRGYENGNYTYMQPTIYSSGSSTITTDTTFSKAASPEYESSNNVTRGYHHNRVDYLINDTDLDVTNGTLIIEPGVVIAIHATTTFRKIHVTVDGDNTGKIYCAGKRNGNIFEYPIIAGKKQVSMFVEKPVIGSASECTTGIRLESADYYNKIRYTKFIGLQNGIIIAQSSQYEVMDCVFTQLRYGITCLNYLIETENHLMYYNTAGTRVMNTGACSITFRNLTCDYCDYGVFLDSWDDKNIEITDSLFSNCDYGIKFSTYEGTLDEDYNRYYNVTTNISTGGTMGNYSRDLGDDPEDTPYDTAYEEWKDRWHLDQTKTGYDGCVNAGSCNADETLLYDYTTILGADLEDADGDILDIGYHYEDIVPPDFYYHCVTDPYFSPNSDDKKDITNVEANTNEAINWLLEIKDSGQNIIFSDSGASDYIYRQWDGGSESDGNFTYYISGTDISGNPFETINDTITIDRVAPTNSSISIDEGATTTDRYINLTLSSDNATEMIISENEDFQGASWEEYAEEKEFALSFGGGSKIIYAKFRDEAWNETEAVNDTITYDAAPAIGNVVITNRYFSPNDDDVKDDITITAGLSETCDWSLQIIASDSTIVKSSTGTGTSIDITWNGVYNGNVVNDGVYVLKINAEDSEDNSALEYSNQIIVDTEEPIITAITPTDSDVFYNSSINVLGKVNEQIYSCNIKISSYPTGSPFYETESSISGKTYSAKIDLYADGDGYNDIIATVVDMAGNSSSDTTRVQLSESQLTEDPELFISIIDPINYSIHEDETIILDVESTNGSTLSVKLNGQPVSVSFSQTDHGTRSGVLALEPLYEINKNLIEVTATIADYEPVKDSIEVFRYSFVVCYSLMLEDTSSMETAVEKQYYNPYWFEDMYSMPFISPWTDDAFISRYRTWGGNPPVLTSSWTYNSWPYLQDGVAAQYGADSQMWGDCDHVCAFKFHTRPDPIDPNTPSKTTIIFKDLILQYGSCINDYYLDGQPFNWMPNSSEDAYVELELLPDTDYTIISKPELSELDTSFSINTYTLILSSNLMPWRLDPGDEDLRKKIYVIPTFDDGPNIEATKPILALLRNPFEIMEWDFPATIPSKIKAAFFLIVNLPVVGGHTQKWNQAQKNIVIEENRDGHILGLHRKGSINSDNDGKEDGDDAVRVGQEYDINGNNEKDPNENRLHWDMIRGEEIVLRDAVPGYTAEFVRPANLTCNVKAHNEAYKPRNLKCIRGTGGKKKALFWDDDYPNGGRSNEEKVWPTLSDEALSQWIRNAIVGEINEKQGDPLSIIMLTHDKPDGTPMKRLIPIYKGINRGLNDAGFRPCYTSDSEMLKKLLQKNEHKR